MQPDVLPLSDLEPAFTQEPLPIYARLREETPVRRVVRLGLPAWLVTRHADVMLVLSDARFTVDRRAASADIPPQPSDLVSAHLGLSQHLAAFDGVDHARLRRLVSKAFTPRR